MSKIWTGKGMGKKIGIKFTEPLVGDVTGLTPTPLSSEMVTPAGVATASGQYSATYTPDRLLDGSTSTQWYIRTTGDQWVQVELNTPAATNGFRWYIGSSYRPNAFTVQGSSDGTTWTTIHTDNSPNTTGWHDFSWTWVGPYKFYRWTVTSRHSTYIYIYEIEMSIGRGNEGAFTITGMECDPLFIGTPTLREYKVESITRYIEDGEPSQDTILLTMAETGRFMDTTTNLSVYYDATKGTLAGNLDVDTFTRTFEPEGLEPTPNHAHTVTATATGLGFGFLPVAYEDGHTEHAVTATASELYVELIPIGEIPP